MNLSAYVFALTMVAGAAHALSVIDQLCGLDQVNQATVQGDVTSNPDGYYVRSLQTQLSHGDPRIIRAVGREYHLCTGPAATPDMDANQVMLLNTGRAVKYLFILIEGCPKHVS